MASLALAGAALAVSWAGRGSAASPSPPRAERLAAYGGYSAVAPENTLAAIRAAAAAGATRVWVDVRATRDGALVLLRDPTLDRTTSCRGPVSALPAADVARCDAGAWFDPAFAGEPVPLLADAIAAADAAFALELHAPAVPEALAVIATAGVAGRVTLVSADEAVLAEIRAADPAISTWLRVETLDGVAATLERLGAAGVAVDADGLDVRAVGALRAAGYDVAAVGVDDEAALLTLDGAGVNRLATARFGPMARLLGYTFRTYAADAFGAVSLPQQAFARTLAVADFNGDRRDDLVVGAPLDGGGAPAAGWVGVSLGGGSFPGPVLAETRAESNGQWGSVFGAADFGADGFDDLAIGYPLADFQGVDSGVIWLWDGAAGFGQAKRPIGPNLAPGAQVGGALAGGDFNGDSVTDLVVGAPGRVVRGQAGAGDVTVMPGVTGSGPIAGGALVLDRSLDDVPGEPAAREQLGGVIATGDFDGDGYADVALGVPLADTPAERDAGAVLVAYGAPEDAMGDFEPKRVDELTRADPRLPGDAERDGGFGAALAAADFDGDGLDDLVVGAPGATVQGRKGAGDVVVLYGHADGLPAGRAVSLDQDVVLGAGASGARDGFGSPLSAGDVDGDARPDLVIGAPHKTVAPLTDVGGLVVVYAGEAGLDPRVALRLAADVPGLGMAPAIRLGFAQALAVGDLNGDEVRDLAIGVPGLSIGGAGQAGVLLVAWGYHPDLPGVPTPTPPPPTATPTTTPTGPVTPSSTPTPTITAPPSVTPAPSATPRPPRPIHLPLAVRLRAFPDRWPTPAP